MGKKAKYDLKQMKLTEIFNKTSAIFNSTDVLNFCSDPDFIEAFITVYHSDFNKLEELLLNNENKLDKEKLVYNLYLNYIENRELIEEELEQLAFRIVDDLNSEPQIVKIIGGNIKINSLEEFKEFIKEKNEILTVAIKMSNNKRLIHIISEELEKLSNLEGQKMEEEICLKNCRKLLKDQDIYIERTSLDNDGYLEMFIHSSKEEIDGQPKSSKKDVARLNEIDNEIGDDGKGLRYILQSLVLTDLEQIMPESKIGIKLREIILINAILGEGKVSIDDINNMKSHNHVEYEEFIKTAPREEYLEELRKEIVKNARHIDIDKLFLICVYRYEDYLESTPDFNSENYKDYRELVLYVMSKIKNIKTEFEGDMLCSDGEERYIKYTYEDADKFLVRLTEEKYVSKAQINQYRGDLVSGKINISDIEPEVLQLLDLSNEQYDKVINSSDENAISIIETANLSKNLVFLVLKDKQNISRRLFDYVIENEKISVEDALELYYSEKISEEYFEGLVYNEEFLDLIDIEYINDMYMKLKLEQEPKEEEIKRLEACTKLFKHIYIDNKHENEKMEAYNNVMYKIAETFEDENDILHYYKQKLISLDIIVEWCGEDIINRIYNDTEYNKEDLKCEIIKLSKKGKISKGLAEQILLTDNTTYDELMSLILQNAISKTKIVDLYMQGKIFDADFEEMLNNGIISHEEYFIATELRTQEKLEQNAAIKLSPKLRNIPDKKDIIFVDDNDTDKEDDWYKPEKEVIKKTLIHPEIRREYLKLLGAQEPEDVEIDEDNAFYHYEFFVIPNKDGMYDLNSVVVAERFYNDKIIGRESGYALDNATYFFQYKDLMVNRLTI